MQEIKPNILLFFTDQHALDAIACYGDTPCRTPNIDELAKNGVRFMRNYTACPLCSPARASVLTGREVHVHGVTTNVHEIGCNVSEIPDSPDLLSRRLLSAGYNCGYTGKWHIGDGKEKTSGNVPVSPAIPSKRGFVGQDTPQNRGGWNFEDFRDYLREMNLEDEIPKYRTAYGEKEGKLTVVDHPLEGTCEYFLANKTIGLINDFKKDNKPFFIWHNTWGPHGAYISHRSFYNIYKDLKIPEPENFRLDPESDNLPLTYKRNYKNSDWSWFEEQKRRYYALTTQIDAMLGRIVDHLKAENLFENTVIIFTSDHGSHFGYHGGLTDKGFSHFEEAQRTGCIIMDPRKNEKSIWRENGIKTGGISSEYTSLLDIYPTILDIAEAGVPDKIDGRSLLPLIRNENPNWRDHAFVEFYGLGHVITTMLTIVYNGLKYGWNPTNKDELYDLERDPAEQKNQIDNPVYSLRLKAIREKMSEHLKQHNHVLNFHFRNYVLKRNYPENWDERYTETIKCDMPLFERWNYRSAEYTRTRLHNKGEELKFFFEDKTQILNEKIKFIDKYIMGEKVAEYVNDGFSKGGVLMRVHSVGYLTRPYTGFNIRFKAMVNTLEGEPPCLMIKEKDSNCDYTGNNFPLPIEKEPDGLWKDYSFDIKTSWKGHAVYVSLDAPNFTRAEVQLADFTITQTTEAFEMLKNASEVFRILDHRINVTDSWEFELPGHEGRIELFTRISDIGFKGKLLIKYEWLDDKSRLLGMDLCTIESEEGIRKEWDSILIRWNRFYGDLADNVQMEMTRHQEYCRKQYMDFEDRRVILADTSARKLKIIISDKSEYTGGIYVNKLLARTY